MERTCSLKASDVIATYYHTDRWQWSFKAAEHAMVYVARGCSEVAIDGKPVSEIGEEECVFVRKDHRLTFTCVPSAEAGFHLSIVLFFPRSFLFDFYRSLPQSAIPADVRRSDVSVLKLKKTLSLLSLFESFRPYWKAGIGPDSEWLRTRLTEGLKTVLESDSSACASLFDFASRWRPDIMEFMEANYMYDLSLKDFAFYTGRSLATFKRDFSKVSGTTPQRWLTRRRLAAARERLLTTSDPVGTIMADAGFKNFSHFSRAYRQCYGCSPTDSRVPQP